MLKHSLIIRSDDSLTASGAAGVARVYLQGSLPGTYKSGHIQLHQIDNLKDYPLNGVIFDIAITSDMSDEVSMTGTLAHELFVHALYDVIDYQNIEKIYNEKENQNKILTELAKIGNRAKKDHDRLAAGQATTYREILRSIDIQKGWHKYSFNLMKYYENDIKAHK